MELRARRWIVSAKTEEDSKFASVGKMLEAI